MTNALSIRLAETCERAALEALQMRAALSNAGDREVLLANPDAVELQVEQIISRQVFVAERHGAILGFAAVLPRSDAETEIDGLFVEPDCWKQDIGRSLVDRCAEFALAQGSARLHVVGNPHAAGFYTACGFEIVGTLETRFGVGLLMRKQL